MEPVLKLHTHIHTHTEIHTYFTPLAMNGKRRVWRCREASKPYSLYLYDGKIGLVESRALFRNFCNRRMRFRSPSRDKGQTRAEVEGGRIVTARPPSKTTVTLLYTPPGFTAADAAGYSLQLLLEFD